MYMYMFWQSYCKNKTVQFFLPHSVEEITDELFTSNKNTTFLSRLTHTVVYSSSCLLVNLSIACTIKLMLAYHRTRVVVSVLTSRSRDVPTSRLGLEKNCQCLGLGQLRLVPKTNFRRNYAGHINKTYACERALDAGGSEALTFYYQISALSKSCYYHICELCCLRPYLDFKTASTIATSIVHSKLDYCNSLYYNLPQSQITKLQNIQISLARAVTRMPKSSHITPVLESLLCKVNVLFWVWLT